jgi:hypothetical protein
MALHRLPHLPTMKQAAAAAPGRTLLRNIGVIRHPVARTSSTAAVSCSGAVTPPSYRTGASPSASETAAPLTPAIAGRELVTLPVQLPQVMPATFKCSARILLPLFRWSSYDARAQFRVAARVLGPAIIHCRSIIVCIISCIMSMRFSIICI